MEEWIGRIYRNLRYANYPDALRELRSISPSDIDHIKTYYPTLYNHLYILDQSLVLFIETGTINPGMNGPSLERAYRQSLTEMGTRNEKMGNNEERRRRRNEERRRSEKQEQKNRESAAKASAGYEKEHAEMPTPRNRNSRIEHYEKIYKNLSMPTVEKIKQLAKDWINIDLVNTNNKRQIKLKWLRHLSPQTYEYTNNHNAYAKRYVLFTETQKLIQ